MNNFFNKDDIHSAYNATMLADEQKKEEHKKEIEQQKKELYDNKVLKVAEETRDIEKQNLTISKKIFRITKITLSVAIVSGIISLIALFKG